MKLYLISQSENGGWDTYDSVVVAAENEEDAKILNPRHHREWSKELKGWIFVFHNGTKDTEADEDDSWTSPENVKVEYIGEAKEGTEAGVILASFNAG